MRLLEIQCEADSLQACAAAGGPVQDGSLRGWAALLGLEDAALAQGLKSAGLRVLEGRTAFLALGSLSQLGLAARGITGAAGAAAAGLGERAAKVESPPRASAWKLPRGTLPARTAVMAIVNATPDSFSDGGRYDPLAHGLRLAEEGADILDVGGESTRPGAAPVDEREERARVVPVIRELAKRTQVPISVDTTRASVAVAALDAGASIVNDVSGLARDRELPRAAAGAAFCLMHMRGTPADMQARATYTDLHGEVLAELAEALGRAQEGGIPLERIALDPGLGFAKTGVHNLVLLRRLRELAQLGRPLLTGASRKAFIGVATGKAAPDRLFGSVGAAVAAALNGSALVRVHDVAATREALAVADAIRTSVG
ncbi:MAG TPA: dihydropteroate synthase [Myxococcales bacterium]|nr:dihydropteroate synthase [Myxococcales bacterium]